MAGYRPPYTIGEKKAIVKFILDNKAYYSVRGKALWVKMAEAKITDRTWMSLKEHYLKQIYPNISSPLIGLKDNEIELLRRGFIDSSQQETLTTEKVAKESFTIGDVSDSD